MKITKYSDCIAFFDKESFYTKGQTERDIESNRKGGFVLEFRDADGNPLSNLGVKVSLKKH